MIKRFTFFLVLSLGLTSGILWQSPGAAVRADRYIPIDRAQNDRLERARVIRMDKKRHDTIVERLDGSRWLVQHGRTCTSMSTEWPVQLVIRPDDTLREIKVNFNELCEVFASAPLSDEIPIKNYIRSDNLLVPDHQFVTMDQGKTVRVDYGPGCEYLKEFEGKTIYLYRNGSTLSVKSRLFLPGHRGQCQVQNVTQLWGTRQADGQPERLRMPKIQHQAQNNQLYFYWSQTADDNEHVSHYVYGHSRYPIDPDDYPVSQLPNVRRTRGNQMTIQRLQNDRTYMFFFAPMSADRVIGEWTVIQAAPVNTKPKIVNKPDFEPFEIRLIETTETDYLLTWPKMKDVKRYRVIFFADKGARYWMKHLGPDETSIRILKQKEHKGKGLRLFVRVIPRDRYGFHHSDGHYWKAE